jgi:hypothetical protein
MKKTYVYATAYIFRNFMEMRREEFFVVEWIFGSALELVFT